MSMPFDRLAYIDRLKDAGIEEPVARAHAQALREALEEGVATKGDVEGVEAKLSVKVGDVRSKLENSIAELRTEFKADITELRTELKADIAELKADIQRLDSKIDITARDLVIKGAGGLVVLASLMIGLKLFG